MAITQISPQEFAERLQQTPGMLLMDVRTPAEFREVHAEGAVNVPLDQLDGKVLIQQEPYFFICRSGARGQKACERMQARGVQQLFNITGGTQAWEAAGLPVVRGRKSMSLERQVRIVAGALVVLGVVLAATVHPYLIGISAFVGSGLVFAGVTDTCTMGLLLAKLPWNTR
jgi:rhodanese-related sulfurtransferase